MLVVLLKSYNKRKIYKGAFYHFRMTNKTRKVLGLFLIIFLFAISLVITSSLVSAASCYQEQADKYSVSDGSCGLNYSGEYRQYRGENKVNNAWNDKVRDGVWTTYDTQWGLKGWNYRLESDYKLPSAQLNSAVFKVKLSMIVGPGLAHTDQDFYLSIPSRCLSGDTLRLAAYTDFSYAEGNHIQFQCHDGDDWINLGDPIGKVYQNRMYEEAITWDVNTLPPATCSTNSECGTDGFIGQPTCSGNNRIQNYRTFTCNLPGTTLSFCSNTTTSRVLETCAYGCSNGVCNSAPGVSGCYQEQTDRYSIGDGNCGLNYSGEYRQYRGENKVNNGWNDKVRDGVWDTYDNQWGLKGWNYRLESDYKLPSQNVVNATLKMRFSIKTGAGAAHDTRDYTFAIPSQCLNSTNTLRLATYAYQVIQQGDTNFIQIQCNAGNSWMNVGLVHHVYQFRMYEEGMFWNVAPLPPSTCSANSECGTDGFVGQPTCSGNNRVQNYRTFTCNLPGTTLSFCSSTMTSRVLETCAYGCSNGVCNSNQSNQTCTSNANCASNQYCQKTSCSASSVGTCVDRPQICLAVWMPVCGCNGQTYSNICYANFAGINIDLTNATCNSNQTCSNGDTRCIGTNYQICQNNAWANQGQVLGHCGVNGSCNTNADCGPNHVCENHTCVVYPGNYKKKFYGVAYGDDLSNDPKFIFCGNGFCDNGENAVLCPEDCQTRVIVLENEGIILMAEKVKVGFWHSVFDSLKGIFSFTISLI